MRSLLVWLVGVMVVAAILGGCGEASSEGSGEASSDPAKIQFESPAVQANGVISPDVVCGAGTFWLPLKWSSVPSGTEELILYFGRFRRVDVDGVQRVKVPFAAMLTGINPKLKGMAANTFPAGTESLVFGTASNCQLKRTGQKLLLELFAMDHPRTVPTSDDFVVSLTEEALGAEQPETSPQAASDFRDEAIGVGRFTATYGP